MEENKDNNTNTLPPKNRVQRVNALLTALDDGTTLPYEQCISSLYGEVMDKLTSDEEKELETLEKAQDKSLISIRNCQNIVQTCEKLDIISAAKADLLRFEKEYTHSIRQIELILRKGANRVEGAKGKSVS